jgi:hypothetical protein
MNIHSRVCVTCNNHKNGSIINMSRCKQCTKTIPDNKPDTESALLILIGFIAFALAFLFIAVSLG